MIPIRDDIPSRTVPRVNYAVITLCSLAFLLQLTDGQGGQRSVERFGMVPLRLTQPDAEVAITVPQSVRTPFGIRVMEFKKKIAPPAVAPWLTLITCMFLHGGWMHFLGNMWFLYIFGDNVEDRLGHVGYAAVYLTTGIAAGLAHLIADPASPVPTIGASGAIAGVMGAYAYLYPHARVEAVLPLLIVFPLFVLPAPLFLGFWFVMQTFNGLYGLIGGQAGGVAWWAHIGGFVAGILVAVAIGRTPLSHEAVQERRF